MKYSKGQYVTVIGTSMTVSRNGRKSQYDIGDVFKIHKTFDDGTLDDGKCNFVNHEDVRPSTVSEIKRTNIKSTTIAFNNFFARKLSKYVFYKHMKTSELKPFAREMYKSGRDDAKTELAKLINGCSLEEMEMAVKAFISAK